jgi:hypothetical protein
MVVVVVVVVMMVRRDMAKKHLNMYHQQGVRSTLGLRFLDLEAGDSEEASSLLA